jgi:hypothetical protein
VAVVKEFQSHIENAGLMASYDLSVGVDPARENMFDQFIVGCSFHAL